MKPIGGLPRKANGGGALPPNLGKAPETKFSVP